MSCRYVKVDFDARVKHVTTILGHCVDSSGTGGSPLGQNEQLTLPNEPIFNIVVIGKYILLEGRVNTKITPMAVHGKP